MLETVFTSGVRASQNRRPEQITSGPTDDEGIAMAPDGRSFVSSVGLGQSTVWIHDGKGDRQISSQGDAFLPISDGVSLTHSALLSRST